MKHRSALVIASVVSASMAVIYLLIGLRVIEVIEPADDQPGFGLVAAAFFAGMAILIASIRRPIVWMVAMTMHLFVAFVYFDLAVDRVPQYETWGLALRALQIPAILALGWLAVHRSRYSGTLNRGRTKA
jgi:hypothetical protein